MRTNRVILGLLCGGAVMAGLLAIFRIAAVLAFSESYDTMQKQSYVTSSILFFALALWMGYYADYRSDSGMLYVNNNLLIKAHTKMKVMSILAGLCCMLRLASVVLYYFAQTDMNFLTWLYVLMELILLGILTVFFFCFAYDRGRKAKIAKQGEFYIAESL